MVSGIMDNWKGAGYVMGYLFHGVVLFTTWLCTFEGLMALPVLSWPDHVTYETKFRTFPQSGLFGPLEISPSALPDYHPPKEPFSPLYPRYPDKYDPVLTGKCPVNFTAISSILDRTASDCSQSFAEVVGDVICCPQFSSLLYIFRGYYSLSVKNRLALEESVAGDCFSDIISLLVSRAANNSTSTICSVNSQNLTSTSCPVNDTRKFEKLVNTSQLLEACSFVDPLKECCSRTCRSAINAAAFQISSADIGSSLNVGLLDIGALNDCKGVVHSWLARKLPLDEADRSFRILSSCKVNQACLLDFGNPSKVAKACRDGATSSTTCCSSLTKHINGLKKQMLVTNKQAIVCATMFASLLQEAGVMTNVYELCDIELKDFSHQSVFGGPSSGCLLRSFPADVIFDNLTGFSITCDLIDNARAPWPLSSSSMSSLSLCAEKSLPARPISRNFGHADGDGGRGRLKFMLQIVSAIALISGFVL